MENTTKIRQFDQGSLDKLLGLARSALAIKIAAIQTKSAYADSEKKKGFASVAVTSSAGLQDVILLGLGVLPEIAVY